MRKEEFLHLVRKYVEQNPDVAAYVSDAVQAGLSQALNEAKDRAADMEVALSVLAHKRYNGRDAIVKDKLEKWNGKTCLDWGWLKNQI